MCFFTKSQHSSISNFATLIQRTSQKRQPDCTPNTSHQEQISIILRCVDIPIVRLEALEPIILATIVILPYIHLYIVYHVYELIKIIFLRSSFTYVLRMKWIHLEWLNHNKSIHVCLSLWGSYDHIRWPFWNIPKSIDKSYMSRLFGDNLV